MTRSGGLTVDAWIVADEAAQLSEDIIAALRPMRALADIYRQSRSPVPMVQRALATSR
jgi:hypothetical protein